jgi:hypothetical protein
MSSQFKFKPDKIKYLSTIDTLDSSHKKIVNGINKKRDDVPKKEKKLLKLKNDLELLDSKNSEVHNYISVRTKIIDEINNLKEEIDKIENYEDELEYYEKTHEILFNYYDIIDGHKIVSTNNINNNSINININILENHNITNDSKFEMISDIKIESNSDILKNNIINSNIDIKNIIDLSIVDNITNLNDIDENKKNQWEIDGIEIFKKSNTLDKLDILNQMSKMKRKEKKTTRKRVKNVESLVRDSNNIFDYLEANTILINNQNNKFNADNPTTVSTTNNTDNTNVNTPNTNVNTPNTNTNTNNTFIIDKEKYDRASLFEDYKILLDGYSTQKKINKPCINCGPPANKVLMYSEGFYVCLVCGEVEKCIIENEITNYKDPMVEKPTFPYKRKNHFCEWIKFIFKFINRTLIMS